MERKSLILVCVMGLLLAGAVAVSCYRFFAARDYLVQGQTACDPAQTVCFGSVIDCEEDPAACESGQPATQYYKYYHRLARHIPLCDPASDPSCTPLACQPDEAACGEILCGAATVSEGEFCSDPMEFMRKDLEEKQSPAACDPSDPACETSALGETPDLPIE